MPSALARMRTSPDPDGVGGVALQGALVLDVRVAVRRLVVDEEAVLLVLAGVGEVDAEALEGAARTRVARVGGDPHDLAAEGHRDVAQVGVAADEGVVLGHVEGVVVPLLHGDEGEVRAVADLDLDVGAALGGAAVRQHDGGLAVVPGVDDQVAVDPREVASP